MPAPKKIFNITVKEIWPGAKPFTVQVCESGSITTQVLAEEHVIASSNRGVAWSGGDGKPTLELVKPPVVPDAAPVVADPAIPAAT